MRRGRAPRAGGRRGGGARPGVGPGVGGGGAVGGREKAGGPGVTGAPAPRAAGAQEGHQVTVRDHVVAVAPVPPMRAWEELVGRPRMRVMRFQVIAPSRPARRTCWLMSSM